MSFAPFFLARITNPATDTPASIRNSASAITFFLLFAVGLDLAPADFARVQRHPRGLTAGLLGPLLVLPPLALVLVALFRPRHTTPIAELA